MLRTVALFVLLSVPSPAHACWDGTYATLGDVDLMSSEVGWSPERVGELATWLRRIDAVLPDGAVAMVEFGDVSIQLPDGTALEPAWDGRSLAGLFDVVAAAVAAPADRVRVARSLVTPVYGIQVGAFSSGAAAEAFAASVTGEHGFVEVGGFPADNPVAHVIEVGGTYRVVIGAFVDRASAASLAASMPGAFVRLLSD